MKRTGWYILLVKQGFETSIKESLDKSLEDLQIEEVLVSEDLSGYVFIRSIEILHESLHNFLNLNGALRFLGSKRIEGKVTLKRFCNSEINRLSIRPIKHVKGKYHIGDQVIIRHGDLADIEGKIVEIKKRIVKIKPIIFHKIVRARLQDIEFI